MQIRTYDMHYHSELGVAAHWRYKETGQSKESSRSEQAYDDKISYLRQLLSWRDEITDSAEWVAHFKKAELDDTIYVLTPQGQVLIWFAVRRRSISPIGYTPIWDIDAGGPRLMVSSYRSIHRWQRGSGWKSSRPVRAVLRVTG